MLSFHDMGRGTLAEGHPALAVKDLPASHSEASGWWGVTPLFYLMGHLYDDFFNHGRKLHSGDLLHRE